MGEKLGQYEKGDAPLLERGSCPAWGLLCWWENQVGRDRHSRLRMAGCHPHHLTAVLMLQPTDASLSTADQQERLSVAYVLALAARAGYTTSQYDLDRTGIDMDVHSEEQMQPASLSLQLKATSASIPSTGWRWI